MIDCLVAYCLVANISCIFRSRINSTNEGVMGQPEQWLLTATDMVFGRDGAMTFDCHWLGIWEGVMGQPEQWLLTATDMVFGQPQQWLLTATDMVFGQPEQWLLTATDLVFGRE